VLLDLPDSALTRDLPPETLRLELACALFGRGRLGKVAAAELAGVSLVAFQRALGERQTESYTLAMLDADERNLRRVFPE
jgi:predicted HTH domain antitoxin